MLDRSNFAQTITVLVGEKEQSFIVHQDIICASSEFFRAAVSKGWQEEETKTVRLREHSPAAFKIYLEWLYVGKDGDVDLEALALTYADELIPEDERIPETILPRLFAGHALCKLWMLGDFLDDEKFNDDVIAWVHNDVHGHQLGQAAAALEFIWENAGDCEKSSLRRLVEDKLFAAMVASWFSMWKASTPASWLAAWLSTYVEEAGERMREEFRDSCSDEKYIEELEESS